MDKQNDVSIEKHTRLVKKKEGRAISTGPEQRARRAEHFHDIFNRPTPPVIPDIINAEGPSSIHHLKQRLLEP